MKYRPHHALSLLQAGTGHPDAEFRDSRWTLTVAAWLLRSHGSGEVWPFALALTSHG